MGIHFIAGPASSGKSSFLYKNILELASFDILTDNRQMKHVIVVTPEQFSLRTEQDLVALSKGHGIMNIEVLSFTRLAYRLMEEAGDEGYPVLNDMGKSMVLRKVMQELKPELKLYGGKEKNPGFIDEIKSLISELSQYMITPEVLESISEKHINSLFGFKSADLSKVFSAFNKKLEGIYTTSENLLQLSFSHISSSKLLNNAILVFDGFTGFTPVQFKFIENLMGKVSDMYVCLTADASTLKSINDGTKLNVEITDNPGIFSMTAECVKKLLSLCEMNSQSADLLSYDSYKYLSPEISNLTSHLFRHDGVNNLNTGDAIKVGAFRDKKEEAEFIAARISDLLRNENYKFSEIAIITGDLEGYLPHFRKSLKSYGISFYADESRSIEANALIQLICQLLNVAIYDYRTEDVVLLLKSPLFRAFISNLQLGSVGDSDVAVNPTGTSDSNVAVNPIVIADSDAIVNLTEISEGKDSNLNNENKTIKKISYQNSTEADEIICQFENYLNCYTKRGRGAYQKNWTAKTRIAKQINLEGINALRKFLLELFKELPSGSKEINVHDLIVAIYNLLVKLEVSDNLNLISEKILLGDAPEKEGIAKEYSKVWEAVMSIFTQINDIMGEDVVTLQEFKDIFMTGAAKTKLGILPPNPDVVTIGDVWRTRLKGIRALFFAGMNEGVIPRPSDAGGLFTETERKTLAEENIELAISPKSDPAREEFYVYLAMSKPSDKIYLSYSLTRDDKEASPSYMFNEVLRLCSDLSLDEVNRNAISDMVGFDNGISYFLSAIKLNQYKYDAFSLKEAYNESPAKSNEELQVKTNEEIQTKPNEDIHSNINQELQAALEEWYKESDSEALEKINLINDFYASLDSINVLSKETADRLYDHIIKSSVSKIEMYSECPFKYFMQYGLKINEAYENEPENFDYGNVFHEAMKNFMIEMNNKGFDYLTVTAKDYEPVALECLKKVLEGYCEGLYSKDERIENYTKRMERVILTSAATIVNQIRAGKYRPWKFEVPFSKSGIDMQLTGKIDRVDKYEVDGNTYLKVVDYKTGTSKIDYSRLYYGIQLQLPLYMSQLLCDENIKNPLPGACLYQHLDDPSIEMTKMDTDVEAEKKKKLKAEGLISSEPENIYLIDSDMVNRKDDEFDVKNGFTSTVAGLHCDKSGKLSNSAGTSTSNPGEKVIDSVKFKKICDFADKKVRSTVKEILGGKADVSPFMLGDDNACKYCSYSSICGFDEKLKCFDYRKIKLSGEEALDKILKSEEEYND
jgi:ATP-dependent helicase/nuclease subunit B